MPSSQPSLGFLPSQQLSYATATKDKPAKTDMIITLLTELLSAISTTEDPKTIISATINSFLSLLKNNYERPQNPLLELKRNKIQNQ